MEKIALVTDSTADLSDEIIKKFDIKVLRLKVLYKDAEYIDGVTITSQEVFNNLEKEIPTTSTPQMSDADELFSQLESEGYTHVIGIHISSGISGTLNMVKLAKENHPNLTAYLFDSLSLSLGEGALVIACGEMIKQGKSFEEITCQLPAMRDKISVYFVLDTLEYLIKGGRMGKVSGKLGTVLDIRPIINIGKDGIYHTHSLIKGKKHAIKRFTSIVKHILDKTPATIWVMQGDAVEEGMNLMEKVKKFENATNTFFNPIGPVIGVHTGPGVLGFAIVREPLYT